MVKETRLHWLKEITMRLVKNFLIPKRLEIVKPMEKLKPKKMRLVKDWRWVKPMRNRLHSVIKKHLERKIHSRKRMAIC